MKRYLRKLLLILTISVCCFEFCHAQITVHGTFIVDSTSAESLHGRDGKDAVIDTGLIRSIVKALIAETPPASVAKKIGGIHFVTNEAELRAAFAGYFNGTTTAIFVCNDIGITQSLVWPQRVFTRSKKLVLYLAGSTIYDNSANGLPALLVRSAPYQKFALDSMQDVAIIIRDGELKGKNGTGTLVDVAATYASVIDAVDFTNANVGMWARFCMMMSVSGGLYGGIDSIASIYDMGNWAGATNSNSQSNHSSRERLRVFNMPNAKAAFADIAASGISNETMISEGCTECRPDYHFIVNSKGSTVVKDWRGKGIHLEREADSAGFKFRFAGGYGEIDGAFNQYPMVLVDAEAATGNPHLYIKNVPHFPGGTKLKTTGTAVVWSFDEIPHTFDVSNAANWVNGTKPVYWQQRGLKQSPFWNYNGLQFNNKSVVTQ